MATKIRIAERMTDLPSKKAGGKDSRAAWIIHPLRRKHEQMSRGATPISDCRKRRGAADGDGLAATVRARSTSIPVVLTRPVVLIGADPIAAGVVVAAVVVVVVVITVQAGRRGTGGGAPGCTAPTVAVTVARPASDRAPRITGPASWATRYGMRRPSPSGHAHAAAVKTARTHTAAAKSSAAAKSATSTAATTSKCVAGSQAGSQDSDRCEADQTVPNHDVLLTNVAHPMAFR